MSAQFTFDDLARGKERRPSCRWLRLTPSSGAKVPETGLVILGHCNLYGYTAYDQGCDTCTSWEGKQ